MYVSRDEKKTEKGNQKKNITTGNNRLQKIPGTE